MSFTMPDVAETRGRMLQAYRDGLRDMIEEVTQRIPEPSEDAQERLDASAEAILEWANVPVVTRRDLDEALNAIFGQPVPMPDETWAEVHTPATVVVSAICPRCGLAQPISMTIRPELLVSDDGSELRLKAKAKGRTHICGQLPLPVTEEADGQQELPLDETPDEPLLLAAGEAEEPELVGAEP